jgi:hypothetical protein
MRTLKPLLALMLLAPVAGAAQETVALTAVEDRASREVVIELPATDLPAEGGHDGIQQPPPVETSIPVDGWLQGYEIELLDYEGNPVPRQVVHHINVMQPDRRDLFTPIMLRVAAAGQEEAETRMPWFFGYRVRPGSRLLVTAMLHNPTGRAWQGVRVRIRMPYRSAAASPAVTAVMPFYLDVMPHGNFHSYDLQPGLSQQSWEGRPAVGGRIVAMGAHLHKFGLSLRLEDVTAGRTIWEARPRLDATGEIASMPVAKFILARPRLDPNHVYRLTAVYRNPTGEVIPAGAMGALGGIMVPDDERAWPAADMEHADYRRDREFTLVGSRQGGGHGGHGGGHQH